MTAAYPSRRTGWRIMLVLLALTILLAFIGAASDEATPGAWLMWMLPLWASLLPVALLPRRPAIISGAVIGGSFALLGAVLLALIFAPGHGGESGMWKITTFFAGLIFVAIALLHGGAVLIRWMAGRARG